MMTYKKIVRTIVGTKAVDGAGVELVRVIGHDDVQDADPFLMLDAFDSTNPQSYTKGFPMHPHRGIETISYLIKGHFLHEDSLSNRGEIRDMEAQWMTAGSGILHEEMPQATPHLLGLQLWLNLPREDKMTEPKYLNITRDMIPEVDIPGGHVRVLSGGFMGHQGVKTHHIQALALDVTLEAGAEINIPLEMEDTALVYIFHGDGHFDSDKAQPISDHTAVLLKDGDALYAHAGSQGMRFMLYAAKPLRETIAWGGLIVMNTRDELQMAFRELQAGTFIRK